MEVHPVDHTEAAVAEALVRVQRASYAVEAALLDFADIPNLSESVEDVRGLQMHIAAACEDGVTVGFIGYIDEGGLVEIDRLAVEPSAFRRGFGRELLRYLHDVAPEAEFVVSTGAANHPAIALYTSEGYTVEREHVVAGTLVVVRLRRRGNRSSQ